MSKARTRFLGVFLALFALCALFTVQALAAEPRATVSVSTGAELKAELEKDTTSTISVDDPTGYRVSLASATLRGNHTIILNDNDLYLSAALTIPNGATLRIEQGYLFSSNSLYSSPVIVNDGGSLTLAGVDVYYTPYYGYYSAIKSAGDLTLMKGKRATAIDVTPTASGGGTFYGVEITGGTASFNDVEITLNANTNDYYTGYYDFRGIYQTGGRIETITGGSITIDEKGKFQASSRTFCIYQDGSDAFIGTISGVELNGEDKSNQGMGCGIYVEKSAADNLTITGGTTISETITGSLYVGANGTVNEIDNAVFNPASDTPAIHNEGKILSVTKNARFNYTSTSDEPTVGDVIEETSGSIIMFDSLKDGFALIKQEDGQYVFGVAEVNPDAVAVAEVDGMEFASVSQAVAMTGGNGTVKILADTDIDTINVPAGTLTIDLNGHTLTSSGNAFSIKERDTTFTLTDNGAGETKGSVISTSGTAVYKDASTGEINLSGGITLRGGANGVYNDSGKITAENVTIIGEGGYGLYADTPSTGSKLENCTVSGSSNGVHITSIYNSGIDITGGSITSENGYGLYVKTPQSNSATDTVITGSTYGIYHENGNLTLSGVTATGDVAALYTANDKTTTISDETNTKFNGMFATLGDGAVKFSDASYKGFEQDENGAWTPGTSETGGASGDNVAAIGTTEYTTFAAAFNAAENGDTVKLIADAAEEISATLTVTSGETITVDLNGHDLVILKAPSNNIIFDVAADGALTLTDNAAAANSGDERGASEEAGRLLVIGGTADIKLVSVTGSVKLDRANIEMTGSKGTAIFIEENGTVESITDSTIIAPWYGIYNGSTFRISSDPWQEYPYTVGDITNSVFKTTNTSGHSGGNSGSYYNPAAIYLRDQTLAADITSTFGDIANCSFSGSFYGVYIEGARSVGTITGGEFDTGKYEALGLSNVVQAGDIEDSSFKANYVVYPSYMDAHVISISYSNVGRLEGLDVYGGTGIVISGNEDEPSRYTVGPIVNCEVTANNFGSGTYTTGSGLDMRGVTIKSGTVAGYDDPVSIYGCEITAYEGGIAVNSLVIEGDVANCTATSETTYGFGSQNNLDCTYDDFVNCNFTGNYHAMELHGTVGNIVGCKLTTKYTLTGQYDTEGSALYIDGKLTGKVDSTTLTATGDATTFYLYAGSAPADLEYSFEDCTFIHKNSAGTVTYEFNNVDTNDAFTLRGRNGVSDYFIYQLRSDATLNLVTVPDFTGTFMLGYIDTLGTYPNSAWTTPMYSNDNHTLTLTSADQENPITLKRASGFTGALFEVSNGTLKLENIVLQGDATAEAPLISVIDREGMRGSQTSGTPYSTKTGSLYLGNGAVLTGNTNTSGVAGGVEFSSTDGALTLSGNAQVTGSKGSDGEASNIYLHEGKVITLADGLSDGASIGVLTEVKPAAGNPTVPVTTAESGTEYKYPDALKYFSSDDEDYGVSANTTGHYLQLAIGFKVTVNDTELTDKAYPSSDFTYTIPDYEANSSYDVTVTIGGMKYEGFTIDDGKLTIPGEDISGDIEISYTQSITLTLDPNEGALPADASNTVTAQIGGDAVYPTLPTPVRPGYTFEGWFTDGGTKIEAGGKVELTEDTTLTAKWTAKDITVSFDLNGGSGSFSDMTGKYGGSITLPADEPTRDGYTFAGWSDGKNTYDPGDSYTLPTEDTTLTAQWSKNGEPTPGFIINVSGGEGGTVSPEGVVLVVSGGSVTITIDPDDGYRVLDVIVDGVSVGAVYSYTFSNVDRNHTLEVVFAKAGVADPGVTGVADSLITDDHIKFLNGYPGGTFNPDGNMTRAEAAQMFYNLLLNKNVQITVSFSDVPEAAWYSDAVNALASMNILNGVGGGKFDPDRAITRAEFTAIAMRFAKSTAGGANIFSDVSSGAWYYDSVLGAVNFGWITGYPDGTFRPNNTITRAEVTTIVNRMLGRAADTEYVDAHVSELVQFSDVTKAHWAYYQIVEATNAHDFTKADGVEDWTALK